MRKVPFDVEDVEPETPQPVDTNDHRVDLSKLLATPVKVSSEAGAKEQSPDDEREQPHTKTSTTKDGDGEEQPGKDPDVEDVDTEEVIDDDAEFDTTTDNLEDTLGGFLDNPQEAAELGVNIFNSLRTIFMPGIQESLAFPGNERNDIRHIVAKAAENEKLNKPAMDGFNDYERRLYEKWPKVQKDIQNISYTQQEIKWFSKRIAKKIATMPTAVIMEKYGILFSFLYLELKHNQNIAAVKVQDMVHKKFGGK